MLHQVCLQSACLLQVTFTSDWIGRILYFFSIMSSLRHNAVLYSHRFDFHSAWRCPVQSSYTKSHNSTQHIATTSKWCSIPNHPIFRCPSFASCDIKPGALFLRSLVIYKHDHQHLWGNTTRWSCRTISGVGNQKKKTKSHDSVGLLCPTGGYFFFTVKISVLTVYLLMYIAHSSVNTFEFAKTKKSLSRRR